MYFQYNISGGCSRKDEGDESKEAILSFGEIPEGADRFKA
jgi:hypothetical protein